MPAPGFDPVGVVEADVPAVAPVGIVFGDVAGEVEAAGGDCPGCIKLGNEAPRIEAVDDIVTGRDPAVKLADAEDTPGFVAEGVEVSDGGRLEGTTLNVCVPNVKMLDVDDVEGVPLENTSVV